MTAPSPGQNWRDIFFTSRDGLRLYARHYAAGGSRRRPALCLPGLTRNVRDFHVLATALADPASPTARDVWAVDYRGRGRSEHDPDWKNYALQVELLDVLDFMTVTGLHDVAAIGTSRGGLLAMLMATARPASLGAVVLNDIGPVIEKDGLLRIAAYVGRIPLPMTWTEATQLVRDMNVRNFPAVPKEAWEQIARQLYDDEHGNPKHSYDQNLGKAISIVDGPPPPLWAQYEALTPKPLLVIRGEQSDILSEKTVSEMQLRHPRMEVFTVRGQGHAPLLRDLPTLTAISEFLARTDAHHLAATRASAPIA